MNLQAFASARIEMPDSQSGFKVSRMIRGNDRLNAGIKNIPLGLVAASSINNDFNDS
jgi:hypothetical protein